MSDEMFRWVIAGGVGIAALAFLVAGIALVVIAATVGKLKAKLDPVLVSAASLTESATDTFTDLQPKIGKISGQAVKVSQLVAAEAERYSELSKDIAERTKAQVARIDGAVDHAVEGAQEVGVAAKRAVLKPMHHIDGVVTGVRAAVATYSRRNRTSVFDATQDEEMFI